jgi:hypothetical protein
MSQFLWFTSHFQYHENTFITKLNCCISCAISTIFLFSFRNMINYTDIDYLQLFQCAGVIYLMYLSLLNCARHVWHELLVRI